MNAFLLRLLRFRIAICALCWRSHTLRLFSVLIQREALYRVIPKLQYSSQKRLRNRSYISNFEKMFIVQNFCIVLKRLWFVTELEEGNKPLFP